MKTATKEIPVLFSGDMVRAILDGRKTMTRRPMKPQPTHRLIEGLAHVTVGMDPGLDGQVWYDADCIRPGREVRCPYGRIGDRLWVRETFQVWRGGMTDCGDEWDIVEGPVRERSHSDQVAYAATSQTKSLRWRPSIHMPKWAARIWLEITDVRVERLNEISEEDARAEGVEPGCLTCGRNCTATGGCGYCRPAFRDSFIWLWNSLYGPDAWDRNDYVWVRTFREVTPC